MQNPDYHPAPKESSPLSPDSIRGFILRKAIVKQATIMVREEQAEIHAALKDGDSLAGTDTKGRKLGTVGRSFPAPKARVTDPELVLLASPQEGREPYIKDEDLSEVMGVLMTHAPHLVSERPAEHWLEATAKRVAKAWSDTGDDTPGWTVTQPEGTTSARPNKLADSAALRLLEGTNGALSIEEGN